MYLSRWLEPPVFPGNKEKTWRAALLNSGNLLALLMFSMILIENLVSDHPSTTMIFLDLITIGCILLLRFFLFQGKIELSGILTIVLGVSLVAFGQALLGTIRTPTTAMLILIIIVAGQLFGRMGFVLSTVSSSIVVLGLILAEKATLLPAPDYAVNITQWISYTFIFFLTAVLTHYSFQKTASTLKSTIAEGEELEKTQTLLKQTQRLAKLGGWRWDLKAQKMFWTDETYRIHGLDPGDIEPGAEEHIESSIKCYDEKDRPIIEEAFQKCAKDGIAYDIEVPFTTLKGNRLWVRTVAHAEEENGEVVRVIGNLMDITRPKQVVDALRHSEERYSGLMQHLEAGIIVHAPDTSVLMTNTRASKLLGLSIDQMVGKTATDPIWKFIDENHTPLSVEDYPISRMASGKQPIRDQILGIHQPDDDVVTWVAVHGFPVLDKSGEISEMVISFFDRTDQKQSEMALAKSNIDLRLAQKIANIGNWLLDPEIGVPDWSEEVYHIYNRDPKLGPYPLADYKILYAAEYWDRFQSAIEGAINQGLPYDIELKLELPSGKVKWINAICEPEPEKGPKGHLLRGTIQDITSRKEVEEALSNSEEKYRLIVENANDGIEITQDDKIIYSNTRFADMLGYSVDEISSISFDRIFTNQAKRDLLERTRKKHSREIKSGTYKTTFQQKGGSIIDVEVKYEIIDFQGKPATFGIIRDITARKQAEGALKSSDAKQRALIGNISDVIAIVDEAGINLYKSPNIEKWFGWNPSELVGESTWNNIHPEDLEGLQFLFGELLEKENSTVNAEYRYLCKDGNYLWVETTATNHLKDENIKGILLNYHDITERKQVEDDLKKSEKASQDLMQNLNAGVVVHAADTHIVFANDQASKLLGLTIDQMMGKMAMDPAWHFTYEDKTPLPLEAYPVAQVFAKQSPIKNLVVGVIRPSTNDLVWLLANAFPEITAQGQVSQVVVTFVDITERKQAEQERTALETQLRQAQKLEAIGTMVGGISHELNNILQGMFLYSGLIEEQLPDDDDLKGNFKQLQNGAEKARDIVKQILTFSRKSAVDFKPQAIHEIILEVLALERASLPANIVIEQDIDKNCGVVLCDKTQIHQIIMNLFINAEHAMKEKGGILYVSLQSAYKTIHNGDPATDALELIISDTGHGIDPADLQSIFDPFFTTKQVGQGTGLGLSVIHGIVDMMAGHISVTSEIAKGTTFSILFPVVDNVEAEEVVKSPGSVDIENRSILLVDDEESIRSVTQIILTRKGFKVDSASDGQQALELFKANPGEYALIVTDQSMPKMSGVELTKAIRNAKAAIPIILSTGQLGVADEKEFKDIGITAFIQKPWTAEELIEKIQKLDDN